MALKKSDLYASLWASCDELRGGMDASQYKDYVLFMLFMKYISDKYGNSKNFAPPVIIPKGASFNDMVALKGNPDIGNKINTQIIQPLINKNTRLSGSDFPDFNDSSKLGDANDKVERLGNLISIFEKPELDFSNNRAENDDILGDAYEYLMKNFASESGKSKGQFYTPSEVSRVIAKVIGISPDNSKANTTVYDPTCGSGSLLLKIASEANKQITLEGQEMDVATGGLARMNMILHDFPTANILTGNTLSSPKFLDGNNLRTYDYVVANPPFSSKTWSTGINPGSDLYQRFIWGTPPLKQGDYAFLLHIIRSMKSTGKAACILPHGVLFRSNAEAVIRTQLIKSGFLKAIIGLPANLFYGTGIHACILVLDKENAAARKGIFMIDARNGFKKDGSKNRLREQDIHIIVDAYTKLTEIKGYSRMVPLNEIIEGKNDFNLNLPRYIESSEHEDIQSIEGHMQGGIPEIDIDGLDEYWKVFPGVRKLLFESDGRPGFVKLKVPITNIKTSIFDHPEFISFNRLVIKLFTNWKKVSIPLLNTFEKKGRPKKIIETLSEDLLVRFKTISLIDKYDVYQHLMDYWMEKMQDDFYLIADVGWKDAALPHEMFKIKDVNGKLVWPKEPTDYMKKKRRFKSDLLPSKILIKKYFLSEHDTIEELKSQLTDIEQKLQVTMEENSGEDDLLSEVIEGEGDKQKITLKSVNARMKEISKDSNLLEEYKALGEYNKLLEKQVDFKKKIKSTQDDLDSKLEDKYPKLKIEEIKEMVVEDKWLANITNSIQDELNQISQTLTGRITELAERYANPLPKINEEVKMLTTEVEQHLKKMGASWK
ncbi:N-6 DNA methylase [Candidatus Pelagibacter sp.]|nr:N-6 DNA methylase [Candidatus Pelagibacter sp.]